MAGINTNVLADREKSIVCKSGCTGSGIKCDTESVTGSVSQRACVFCGARVVLNPITDAFHIVHGPIGCASYTWDIRGSLSSGKELYRNSFSTDLSETDIVFGGEKKLAAAIDEVMEHYSPKVIFVYATCIVGVIGDDINAVCKTAEKKHGIRVIPVMSPGFAGHKSMGYKAACNALMNLITPYKDKEKVDGINILGDFNLAGEMWIIQSYLKQIGVNVVSRITGDASFDNIIKAPTAKLNIVQCAGSMTYLARRMEDEMGIPFVKVSFFGVEDTTDSIMRIAYAIGDEACIEKAKEFTKSQSIKLQGFLDKYKPNLEGKKAAIFVGGGFKAISLIRQFREMRIETVVVGTQTGKKEDYEIIQSLVGENTVILDDTNPAELEYFMLKMGADILVGGVKERPLAYKLGIAFCDHNHERKLPLLGYEGVINFTKEINLTINSPVWSHLEKE